MIHSRNTKTDTPPIHKIDKLPKLPPIILPPIPTTSETTPPATPPSPSPTTPSTTLPSQDDDFDVPLGNPKTTRDLRDLGDLRDVPMFTPRQSLIPE